MEHIVKEILEGSIAQEMRESNPVGTPHNPRKISISSIEF